MMDVGGCVRENLVRDKSYSFALNIIALYRELVRGGEFVLSKQLLRAGTSIGANVEEAQAAQSKADFIAKMSIASKEARETCYWLRLLKDSAIVKEEKVNPLLSDAESLVNLVTAIVKTATMRKKC
jgi:four helix bundle protein